MKPKKRLVQETMFMFRLKNGKRGVVRADSLAQAAVKISNCYGYYACVYLERMSEVENNDYGIYEID